MRSLTTLAALALAGLLASPAAASQPRSDAGLRPRAPSARASQRVRYQPSSVECHFRAHGANVNLDCRDPVLPTNEQNVAVDPLDPRHVVVSSNDFASSGDEWYTTLNGRRWWSGDMSLESPRRGGSDPVTSFDPRSGTVLHASLNFRSTATGLHGDGDVVVSRSTDGGITWGRPVVVGGGHGNDASADEIFNDKPWMVTDTSPSSPYYGRTYVTWSAYHQSHGSYRSSPIMEAHSDDGGRSWSRPQEISGASVAYCSEQEDGPAGVCDQDQGSVGTIGPGGTLSVAFENDQHQAAWEPGERFENQYLVVRSYDGGAHFSSPQHVVDMEDGSADLPLNVNGEQTLSGLQARVWSEGNIAADPRSGHLALVFADNRAGLHDAAQPQTDLDVELMTSRDGVHWRGPFTVSSARSDQFFPWAAYDPTTGELGIAYLDRSYLPSTYDVTLAYGEPGAFSYRRVSTRHSPARDAAFFPAGVAGCADCTTFIGDYIGLAFGSDGAANIAWTDMRRSVLLGSERHHGENTYYARIPDPGGG